MDRQIGTESDPYSNAAAMAFFTNFSDAHATPADQYPRFPSSEIEISPTNSRSEICSLWDNETARLRHSAFLARGRSREFRAVEGKKVVRPCIIGIRRGNTFCINGANRLPV